MMKSKILNANEYDKLLLSLIPDLEKYSFLQGSEGRVFFIDDKFVVKKYFSKEEDVELFNKFCEEIKAFSDMGYAVPKIYSWIALAQEPEETDLYVLEERVKGTMVFDADMSSIYSRCKNFCSKDDFEYALAYQEAYKELFTQIAREYIKTYITTNEQLLNMSESELERFIRSDYEMFINSNYSIPDVQASNVMFDGKKLTIIDNGFLGNGLYYKETPEQIKSMVIRDMFLLFYENGSVRDIKTYKPFHADEIIKLKNQNNELCFEAMRRFVRKATSMLDFKTLSEFDYYASWSVAEEALGNNTSIELMKEIQKGE